MFSEPERDLDGLDDVGNEEQYLERARVLAERVHRRDTYHWDSLSRHTYP